MVTYNPGGLPTERRHAAENARARTRAKLPLVLIGLLGLAVIVIGAGSAFVDSDEPPPLPARVDPLLADLTIAPITELVPAVRDNGARLLRFGVIIANVGEGDFLLSARRSHPLADDWKVIQKIPERTSGHTERLTDASLVYGGDGHNHWHIREVESHVVESLGGEVLGRVVKEGYCFFDTTHIDAALAGSPKEPRYRSRGCGGQLDTTASMGLSVGWGDDYPWHLFQQEVDISNLPDGTYRLRATADPFGWFEELDESNNEFWAEFQLETVNDFPEVTVVRTSVEG